MIKNNVCLYFCVKKDVMLNYIHTVILLISRMFIFFQKAQLPKIMAHLCTF